MPYRFSKHYTREQARALLPQIRVWLERLISLRKQLESQDQQLSAMSALGDTGGPLVNQWVGTMADIKDALLEFHRRQIQIKDLDRGLLDFPAVVGGKEVFLCWEKDEDDVEFWHDLDAGYAGREPLD